MFRKQSTKKFQSTPSVKRVTLVVLCQSTNQFIFQSTPSVKRVTADPDFLKYVGSISIHTLCKDGDETRVRLFYWCRYFNPHPLWRGWLRHSKKYFCRKWFQSTPSVKRVTNWVLSLITLISISIHTLCEEGDILVQGGFKSFDISIHTLCEEGDKSIYLQSVRNRHFNPHPLWRGWRCKQGLF